MKTKRKTRRALAAAVCLLALAALGLLESMLGFDEALCGLMIATYIAMDSFGTAANVTGDGAVAVIVDAVDRRMKRRSPKGEPGAMPEP